jgi:DNA-binding IscR family transcriptional regulator
MLEVYELFIGTYKDNGGYKFHAAKISRMLSVSRQYIAKLVNELVKTG